MKKLNQQQLQNNVCKRHKKNCPSNHKYVALKNKLQARAVGVLSPRKKKQKENFKKITGLGYCISFPNRQFKMNCRFSVHALHPYIGFKDMFHQMFHQRFSFQIKLNRVVNQHYKVMFASSIKITVRICIFRRPELLCHKQPASRLRHKQIAYINSKITSTSC